LKGVKICSNKQYLISIVGINNNSPRISKRSFHSTNHLRVDFILDVLNIISLETMLNTITQAKESLEGHDFSNPSITKALDFLSSDTKKGNITHANLWGFNTNLLEGNQIQSEDGIKEFQKLERDMKNNLENTKHALDLAKRGVTGEAAYLSKKAN
jgi:hypothetical protein